MNHLDKLLRQRTESKQRLADLHCEYKEIVRAWREAFSRGQSASERAPLMARANDVLSKLAEERATYVLLTDDIMGRKGMTRRKTAKEGGAR
jgi:hypothetical protein